MDLIDLFKNQPLSFYLKILTIVTLIAMLYPMIQHPLPKYVYGSDVMHHYKYSFLISQDIKNIATDPYPKMFPITSVLLHKIFNIPLGTSMYLVVLFCASLFPWIMYKLSLRLTENEEISLLSAFLSVAIVIYSGSYMGISMAMPQVVALFLIPLVVYLFLSNRLLWAGLFLGIHIMTHSSWPLTLFFILLYLSIQFFEKKQITIFKPFILMIILGLIVYLPYWWYINSNIVYKELVEKFIHMQRRNVSFFYYPFIIWPPGIILLGIYACWRIYKDKKDWNTSYKFVIVSFITILIVHQSYFLSLTTTSFLNLMIFIPDRVLYFLIYPLAILSAYALFQITKGGKRRKEYLIGICLIFMLISIPNYWQKMDAYHRELGISEINIIDVFHNMKEYDQYVLYNPLLKDGGLSRTVIYMGGQYEPWSADCFLVFSKFKTINHVNFTYVLENKNDPEMNTFIDKHQKDLKEVYSNSEYGIYEFLNMPQQSDTLEDYADQYVYYYNTDVYNRYLTNISDKPLKVLLKASDTKEDICLILDQGMKIDSCKENYDIKVEGNAQVLKEILLTHGVRSFIDNFLWFYDHGYISITPAEDIDISVVLPNKIYREIETSIHLQDIDIYINIDATESDAKIHITKIPNEKSIKLSLKFFARSLEWVDLHYTQSFPNFIFSIPYALIMEFLNF